MQPLPICYRELDWPMQPLGEQLINYFEPQAATLKMSGFWTVDHIDLLNCCQELVKFFDHWGWRVISAYVYTIDSTTGAGPIHTDSTGGTKGHYSARINFPLWGCDQGETLWYTVDPMSWQGAMGGSRSGVDMSYRLSNDARAQEIARLVLKQPTIIRIDQAHQVRLLASNQVRSSLTVKVTPDPVMMICG